MAKIGDLIGQEITIVDMSPPLMVIIFFVAYPIVTYYYLSVNMKKFEDSSD